MSGEVYVEEEQKYEEVQEEPQLDEGDIEEEQRPHSGLGPRSGIPEEPQPQPVPIERMAVGIDPPPSGMGGNARREQVIVFTFDPSEKPPCMCRVGGT